jgi:Flp pilus assembly protein TadG
MHLNNLIRKDRGQAIVELALVLPLVLLILFSIMEFGRVYQAYITVNYLAREGARKGAVGATATEIETLTKDRASAGGLDDSLVTVVTTKSADGALVTVKVTYPYTVVVPLISDIIGETTLPMSAALTMRIE